MPPHHIRRLGREIGFSSFEFFPDPTLAVIALYGLNLATMQPIERPWWKRVVRVARLMLDNGLRRGGICVLTK
jgi:hypothetical protein